MSENKYDFLSELTRLADETKANTKDILEDIPEDELEEYEEIDEVPEKGDGARRLLETEVPNEEYDALLKGLDFLNKVNITSSMEDVTGDLTYNIKNKFFICSNDKSSRVTASIQLVDSKTCELYKFFINTIKDDSVVNLILGASDPYSTGELSMDILSVTNSVLDVLEESKDKSIFAKAWGWMNAIDTLIWCFSPRPMVEQTSLGMFTFDTGFFDNTNFKRSIIKFSKERYIDKFKTNRNLK